MSEVHGIITIRPHKGLTGRGQWRFSKKLMILFLSPESYKDYVRGKKEEKA